jgi:hypothetical protein
VQIDDKNKEYHLLAEERKLMVRLCMELYPEIRKKLTVCSFKDALTQLSNCMKDKNHQK